VILRSYWGYAEVRVKLKKRFSCIARNDEEAKESIDGQAFLALDGASVGGWDVVGFDDVDVELKDDEPLRGLIVPKKYEKLRDKFIKGGLSEEVAKTKAAKIFNATRKRGQKPVTGKKHK